MGFSVQVTPVIFILLLISTQHPATGGGHDPLIVLDDYEDNGIRLRCSSERLISEVQVLWTDSKGENFTGTPLNTGPGSAHASSSFILKPGSGNSVSCKIIDKLLKKSTESSVVIGDVFFPATSPWLAAFVVILLLSILLVIAATYKLRKNNKTTVRVENAQREIEKEMIQLKDQLAKEQNKSQKEIQDAENKIEIARKELEFRRARSKAVNITLDENCKDPKLIIEEKNRVKSSIQKEVTPKLIVVATEGFSDEIHYWEVEVGDKSEWELGVVSEEIRNTLKGSKSKPFLEGCFSLQFSEGKYSLTTGEDMRNLKQCTVVGVSLDQEEEVLSFYNVEEKCLLGSISLDFSGKLYPFFSPGPDDKWLGIRPVSIANPLPSL
ncbi:butyrophilin subfamily 3 member A3 isoform X2 [Struthio camelus]